jgi:rhodanese-related sulfurtransferase
MLKTPKYLPAALFLFLCIALFSCNASSPPPALITSPPTQHTTSTQPTVSNIPTITTKDAYDLVQREIGDANFIILDVRTADEFNTGHIAGAVNLDYYATDFKSKVSNLDQDKQYLVYCRTGIRAAAATELMLSLGFNNIHNLTGGIVQWQLDGYPIVK